MGSTSLENQLTVSVSVDPSLIEQSPLQALSECLQALLRELSRYTPSLIDADISLTDAAGNTQYAVDSCAEGLIRELGVEPERIESAIDLAGDYERRIKFQYDVQRYVDMAISSTINLPAWGSRLNNPDTVRPFADTLARYASGLRGFTVYPDGRRGGQPLTSVDYHEAKDKLGTEFDEHLETNDVCSITGKGGSCGV